MKYLNLTKGFNPLKNDTQELIPYKSFEFSGGEPHIKITRTWEQEDRIVITCRIKSMYDLGLLIVACDALERIGNYDSLELYLPYFPGARQDRVMVEGEPLTAKVYADIINNFGFNAVTILDPHSDVITALLDNVYVVTNHTFVIECLKQIQPSARDKTPFIISPDAGANKKSSSLVKKLNTMNFARLVKCDKERNVNTGEIIGFEVYKDDFYGADCVIVDDICDGGGTFLGLAKELKKKNAGDLYLIVSHGIFSKGFKELKKYFKHIYTTDSWVNDYAMEIPEIEKGSEIVTVIESKKFLYEQ